MTLSSRLWRYNIFDIISDYFHEKKYDKVNMSICKITTIYLIYKRYIQI